MTVEAVPSSSRLLFRAALALFAITVVIGILNGVDLVEFGRDTLLTHVHAGTLGWITLAVMGATIWMFRRPDEVGSDVGRNLALTGVVTIAAYIGAFWAGNYVLRPIGGTLAFIPIVWTLGFAWQRREGLNRDIPRLAMLLALVSLTIGAVLGVLLGLATSGRVDWVPPALAEAHPPTMVIGYLVLAGMAIAEWRLLPAVASDRVSRAGVTQAWIMFAAGMSLLLGIVLDVLPFIMLATPLQVVGIGIFVVRLRRPLRQTNWLAVGAARYFTASMVFLVANVVLIGYIVSLISGGEDPQSLPLGLILALDHFMFIGVMTNGLAGIVSVAAGVRALGGWLEQFVYWGINLGVAAFGIGLISETVWLKRLGTPVMGVALLVLIGAYATRLGAGALTAPPPEPASEPVG